MTFEEAKKILKKEGFHLVLAKKVINQTGAIREFEKPEVCEAIKVANANRWTVVLSPIEWDERETRLKKEYEENTKAPGPGEEQTKEKKGIIYPTTFPKADFYHKYFLNEGYFALKEAASQFNDALLYEQAKKIEELTKEKTNLDDQITILNFFKELNEKVGRKQIKRLGKEIAKLNSIINDKNAVLSDVAEELRLTKIREKNLAELGLKYIVENEELKKELADKVVDKIDAQALKSAESALAYKDKVIADLTKKLNVKHKKYVYYNGTIVAVQRLVNTLAGYAAKRYYKELCDQMVDIAEEGADLSGIFVLCGKDLIDALKKAKDADIWQE